jgi:hypothetical protein
VVESVTVPLISPLLWAADGAGEKTHKDVIVKTPMASCESLAAHRVILRSMKGMKEEWLGAVRAETPEKCNGRSAQSTTTRFANRQSR